MTEGVPYYFRSAARQFVLYNFIDNLQGVGILQLYAALDQAGNGILTTDNTVESDVVAQWIAVAGTSYAQYFDIDFEVIINKPVVFEGIASINVPLKVYSTSLGGSDSVETYADVIITKNGGLLVSGATAVVKIDTMGASPSWTHERQTLTRVTVPKTSFSPGTTLGLTVQVFAKNTDTPAGPTVAVGHDPAGRIPSYTSPLEPSPGYTNFASPESTRLLLNMPIPVTE